MMDMKAEYLPGLDHMTGTITSRTQYEREMHRSLTSTVNAIMAPVSRGFLGASLALGRDLQAATSRALGMLLCRPPRLTPPQVMRCLGPFPEDMMDMKGWLGELLETWDITKIRAFAAFGVSGHGSLPPPGSVRVLPAPGHMIQSRLCDRQLLLPRVTNKHDLDAAFTRVLAEDPTLLDANPSAIPTIHRTHIKPPSHDRGTVAHVTDLNRALRQCDRVTLGGRWTNIPALRLCPQCDREALRGREDAMTCKISTCQCGASFCQACLLVVAGPHDRHYSEPCETAPVQQRVLPFAGASDIPANWTTKACEEVAQGPEFESIARLFSSEVQVVRIRRIQHRPLWRCYVAYRDKVRDNGLLKESIPGVGMPVMDANINEVRLFHGSRQPAAIIKGGFDIRVSQSGGVFFSNKDAISLACGAGVVFVARVTLGAAIQGHTHTRRPETGGV